MRVVLDSNVLLAALATRGLCEAVLEVCLAEHELYLSDPLVREIIQNLARKFKLLAARIEEITSFLSTEFHFVKPIKIKEDACRDRDDLVVLGTALAASAGCLVTGDNDLLVLQKYQGIPILSPRAFHDLLAGRQP